MKGKVEPDGREVWSLLQCWTDRVPLLGEDAQVYAAIVAMRIPVAKMYSTMHHVPTRGTTKHLWLLGPFASMCDTVKSLPT